MPLRVALLVVGLSLGLFARSIADSSSGLSFSTRTSWGPILLVIAGWSAMISALIVLRDRRRCAVLLYAGGALWYIQELASPAVGSDLVFTLALVLSPVGPAVIAHLLLSYATGRIHRWRYRLIVLGGYVATGGVLGLARTAVFDPGPMGCTGCPSNLALIHGSPEQFDSLTTIGTQFAAAWMTVALTAGLWRLIVAEAVTRRFIGPVVAGCLGFLASTAGHLVAGLRTVDGAGDQDVVFWQLEGVFLIAIAVAAAVDPWRARRARRDLTRLVVELQGTPAGGLRTALAKRLGDPDLVIAYPIEDGRRYVDADARAVELPADRPVTHLKRGSVELAALVHRPGTLRSDQQVDDLIASVQLALENERLAAEALVQLAEIRSSGARIIAAGDAERRVIERDLHDGAQQRLVALLISLRLVRSGPAAAIPELDRAEAELRRAIGDLREVAHGVYPVLLKDAGLPAALDALAESRTLTVDCLVDHRYPDVIESSIYLLVARMSDAGPTSVEIIDDPSRLVARVTVDGQPGSLLELVDRVHTLGGALSLTNTDAGVRATLVLPRTA